MNWNAYHFVGRALRDGTPVPENGVTLKYRSKIKLCNSGYHASRKAWQALEYASSHTLCRVHCAGEIIEPIGDDKLVCTERTIIERINATDILWKFARMCALDVVHLWDAPNVVKEYLKTGDEELRAASLAASQAASLAASQAASLDASLAASLAASQDASWSASLAASWSASQDAYWSAFRIAQRKRFTLLVNAEFKRTGR